MPPQATKADEAPAYTFLTMEETMQRFKRASPNALRRDIKRGIAPKPRKVGGRNLFVEAEVAEFVRRIVEGVAA